MTIQEAKDFFETTDFSTETKTRIMTILEGKIELDPETIVLVKNEMQKELEKNLKID